MYGRVKHPGRKPATTIAQRAIQSSGLVKQIKDNVAGFRSATKWKARYRLNDAEVYLYLMPMDVVHVQDGKGGPFVSSVKMREFAEGISEEFLALVEELNLIEDEVDEE
jgi:hypothetical protein